MNLLAYGDNAEDMLVVVAEFHVYFLKSFL